MFACRRSAVLFEFGVSVAPESHQMGDDLDPRQRKGDEVIRQRGDRFGL